MELVSPAGSNDQLIASINAGADAVYLGYKKFSARAYADNFEFSQLKKAVKIAHQNRVKVYLALNTLIKDSEIEEVLYFLNEYMDLCRDGIILQDFGLFKIVRDLFPDARLHASTQINVHNLQSALLLKELGFKRVVLAREMTLEEIGNITKNCDIEIEVFAHGSQCYSYSGNCYFSSFTGSRSGNRGRCTQPCRMKYNLAVQGISDDKSSLKNKNKNVKNFLKYNSYLLSKADLCTLEIIPELDLAGVYALKIEGRMKTPEYAGIVTKIYRKYIDLYYKNPGDYRVEKEDINMTKQIFSRELSTGYYLDKFPENIVSFKKSGSIGNFLGRIIRSEKKIIYIRSGLQINKGDYLEIWTNRGNEQLKIGSFEVSKIEKGSFIYKIKTDKELRLNTGDRVFKFFDELLDREAKSLYINGLKSKKAMPENEFEFKTEAYPDFKLSSASIKRYINEVYDKEGICNKTGREAAGFFEENNKFNLTVEVYSLKDAGFIIDSGVSNVVVNCIPELFYNSQDKNKELFDLNKIAGRKNKKIIIMTPNIIYDPGLDTLKNILNDLLCKKINNFSVSNTGVLRLILDISRDKSIDVNIYLNYMLNLFNCKALSFFAGLIGNSNNAILKDIALSAELSLEEIGNLIRLTKSLETGRSEKCESTVYSYGYFPVMASRFKMDYFYSNPSKRQIGKTFHLIDQKGYEFFVLEDYNKNLLFLNSKKICNFFDLPDFYKSNINNLYIDTRMFNSGQIKEVVGFYSIATEKISKGQLTEFSKIAQSASKKSMFSNYTKGHFYREVI